MVGFRRGILKRDSTVHSPWGITLNISFSSFNHLIWAGGLELMTQVNVMFPPISIVLMVRFCAICRSLVGSVERQKVQAIIPEYISRVL